MRLGDLDALAQKIEDKIKTYPLNNENAIGKISFEYCKMLIDNAPTVESTYVSDMPDDKVKDLQNLAIDYGEGIAVFRRCQKGEWRETGYETGALGITYRQTQCSNCGWEHALPMWWNFCPNCGAKMEVSLNE